SLTVLAHRTAHTEIYTLSLHDALPISLLKQLQAISGASSSSTVLPILENFLFEIKDNTLTISATDLQTSMVTSLPIEAKEEGRVAMPSKILIDTLKTLPDQPVAFSRSEERRVGKELGYRIMSMN